MRLIREEKTFIREAVLLMLPMILQNFVTFSMSMADTFMVGVLGETALAGPISTALEYLGVPSAVATGLALFLAVMLITYFSIVMGELFPKRLGQISPEDTSRAAA